MARGRRTLNRRDLRAAAEAAERREGEEVEDEDEDEEEEDDEEEGEEEGGEDEGEEEVSDEVEDEEEEAPRKKKKPKPKKAKVAKPKPAKRVRTPKTVRQKAVWIVYNNSHTAVARYEFKEKDDAEAHVARLNSEKKTPHFVQLVKEPWEEKKE